MLPAVKASVFPGLGLDVLATLFTLAGIVLCQDVWPKPAAYDPTDPGQKAAAYTVLGVFLLIAATLEVGACVVRAVHRAGESR